MQKSIWFSFLISLSVLLVGLYSCNKKGDETPAPPEEKTFDRAAMLVNIFDQAVLPSYEAFIPLAQDLATAAASLSESPSQATLEAAQKAWKTAKLRWETTEVFDLGTVSDLFLHNKIDKFPPKLAFLETNLDSDNTLDQSFVNNSGSTAKGFAALEYLLFRSETGGDILDQFTSNPRQGQYRTYVKGLADDLVVQILAIQQEIEAERTDWISKTGDGISGSINELANAQVAILEEVISNKIHRPLGYDNDGIPEPESVESPYAAINFEAIKANLEGVEKSFRADENGPNIFDLLDFVQAQQNDKISTTIQGAFANSYQLIDSFSNTLAESVINDKAAVEILSEEISKILVAIKVDMTNQLGLTIVFNDTDGD